MRIVASALTVLLLACGSANAVVFLVLNDEFDDRNLVDNAQHRLAVKFDRARFQEFSKSLLQLKVWHFIALFGKPQPKPDKSYAMPVAQARGLAMSGLRHGDETLNKDHTDFYVVEGAAALEVYYGIDGETPIAILLYFPVDKDFPKLAKDNLTQRLAWDADCFERLKSSTQARRLEVFPWEVDGAELAKLESGDFAADSTFKLLAWVKSGKDLGYTYEHAAESGTWTWRDSSGKLVRKVASASQSRIPYEFVWFHPDGQELRKETFQYRTDELQSRRWCRADTGATIRYETRDAWSWCDKDGKVIRLEWDDNSDGIPDWYRTVEDGIDSTSDRTAKRHPLKPAESWAVDQKLIPEVSRISDQPDLRIPVRRKVIPARSK